jgi:hypothetical protein
MVRVQYISQIEAYLTQFDECIIVKVATRRRQPTN